jgi:hypothetical protein
MSNEENFRRFVALRLGLSDVEIDLNSRADTQYATQLMTTQVQSTLDLFSRDLDPALYGREAFLDALNSLCRHNRKARVRMLVQDPPEAVRRSPRLIELARRLSSSIEVRQPHHDYRHFNEAFLVADQCGLIHCKFADRYEGEANFNAPVAARRLVGFFTEVWDRSEVHPEFRRLNL